jgi:membrane protein YqaA with SNARE-associated domain
VGFCGGDVFFIVPDVFTSRVALIRPSQAFMACFWAALGGVIGGSALYAIARTDSVNTALMIAAFDYLPGVTPRVIDAARDEIARHGVWALFTGTLAGLPYKLFAVQASLQDVGYGAFLAVSAVSRTLRFLAVTALARAIDRILLHRLNFGLRARLAIHLAAWAVFYAVYFFRMSR